MTLFRVSKIDIKRLNQTAVRPILLSTKLSPNAESANKRIKNKKRKKPKLRVNQTLLPIEILVEGYLAF